MYSPPEEAKRLIGMPFADFQRVIRRTKSLFF
jgi:hypothetical protein